jgi:hypothetical protein
MVTRGTEMGMKLRGRVESSRSMTLPGQRTKVSRESGMGWPWWKGVEREVRSKRRWEKVE